MAAFVVGPLLASAAAISAPPVLPSAGLAIMARTVDCIFEIIADANTTCEEFASEWGLSETQFADLNPTIDCPDLPEDTLCCVIGTVTGSSSSVVRPDHSETSISISFATGGPSSFETSFSTYPSVWPSTSTTLITSTSSSLAPSTTVAGGPSPTQLGLTASCDSYYFVVKGDTCTSIEAKYGLSAADFLAWNPALDSYCLGLLAGYYVCVGVPDAVTTYTQVAPTTTPKPATTTTTPPPTTVILPTTTTSSLAVVGTATGVPSPLQPGTFSNCSLYHQIVAGDLCSSIEAAAGISAAEFFAWNSGVNTACTNIFLGDYLCVAGGGATTGPPSPLQPGTETNCTSYHLVVSGDTCAAIESAAGITSAEFMAWNTGINAECTNLELNYYVCIGTAASGSGSGAGSSAPSPLQPGTEDDCTAYHLVVSGDTCSAIESSAGITSAQFAAWNTGVNAECTNIELGYYVCIAGGTGGSDGGSGTGSGGTGSSVPSPLQPGTEDDCTAYHLVVSGDTCSAIEADAGITAAQFAAWNTGVNAGCTNIEVGYYLCIEGGSGGAATGGGGGGGGSGSSAPSPLQPGTEADCTAYHLVISGDTCSAIESSAGISSAQFAAWNTGVDAGCTNIEVGAYLCIAGGTNPVSSTPSPLQPGTLATCSAYHLIVSGDYCAAIESSAGITSDQFYAWNTGVNAACTNIEVGYYVCIAD
ncbi:MAG: hypothetical protein STHCBS139747_004755 [Sporothrix thermara]